MHSCCGTIENSMIINCKLLEPGQSPQLFSSHVQQSFTRFRSWQRHTSIYSVQSVAKLFDKAVLVIVGSSPPSIIHDAQCGYIDTNCFCFENPWIYCLLVPLYTFWVMIRRFSVDFPCRRYIDNCICSFLKNSIFGVH